MRRLSLTVARAAATAALVLVATAASAQAATSSIAFTPCPGSGSFGCAHLTVPLDPSGAIPGEVSLSIRRRLAATGAASEAVIALAGGPGQAALPFADEASQILSSTLGTRDLVVFDQRGTGFSGPLKCSAFSRLKDPLSKVIPTCATQIGTTRGLYTTDDSVFDIEQIRKALGYTKLVLYGTSYGTKVALRYAATYPANVAALVLDSTVLPDGPEVFDQPTYQAVPRILHQLCAAGACPGITSPVTDLQKVLGRLAKKEVKASYFTGDGTRVKVPIIAPFVAQLLLSGDEDPVLRADFPAAIHAAAAGHYGLLAILIEHAVIGGSRPNATIDNPLFFDTECEELPFPWTRTGTPAQRLDEALAAAKALPAGSFGPFSYATAVAESSTRACSYWPFASTAPEASAGPLPNVPTLVLSGAGDMRTPTANALALKAMIPDTTIVVVPNTGHSVLTTEFGTCAQSAVAAFFTGATVQTSCSARPLPGYLRPARRAPSSLAATPPAAGTRGTAGRTADAVALTIDWASRELSESLFETLIGSYNPAYKKGLGGLHGGFAKQSTSSRNLRVTVKFHSFSYVAGVTVTGAVANGLGTIRVAGSRAASGTLTAKRANVFSGTLGGVHVRFVVPRPR